jgi:hypothetical protein
MRSALGYVSKELKSKSLQQAWAKYPQNAFFAQGLMSLILEISS